MLQGAGASSKVLEPQRDCSRVYGSVCVWECTELHGWAGRYMSRYEPGEIDRGQVLKNMERKSKHMDFLEEQKAMKRFLAGV